MTAIAGVVGSANATRLASRILDEQRIYGSDRRSSLDFGNASFAVSPFAGDPAIATIDKRWMLVADVRLDNGHEIAERVGIDKAASVAHLLLAAWIKAGEDSLSWIAGDFALAILDSDNCLLTLARDPTGQSPLFYVHSPQTAAFSSMPVGLSPVVGPLRIDKQRLAMTACQVAQVDARSHFEQIRRVLPGEVVRISRGNANSDFYWKPSTATHGRVTTSDMVEQYRSLLDQAVSGRLQHCRHPVATHLSSGYDSSAVTATAARLLGSSKVVAFTSAPKTSSTVPENLWRMDDESGVAANTAAHCGIRHHIVRTGPSLAETVRRQSWLSQEPPMSAFNLIWWTQIRKDAAALGANCLLTAELGNFTLNTGGLYVLAEWLRRRRFLTWWREARLAAARPDTRWRGVLFMSLESWLPQAVVDELRHRFLGLPPFRQVSFLRPEWTKHGTLAGDRPVIGLDSAERIRMLRIPESGAWRKGALADDGVDESDPMSDRRLIEFSLRLPPEQLYWRGVSRPLARAALSDRLPKSVIDLPRRGLQAADWAVQFTPAEARAMLEEVSASSTAQELLDLKRIREAIDRWPRENWNELGVAAEFRLALVSALCVGMFSLVHDRN